jgi:imidazolonepropionase
LGLTQAQAVAACTINAAWAIGRGREIGSLEEGKQADFVVLEVGDYRQLGYRYGTNLAAAVIKAGRLVAADGKLVPSSHTPAAEVWSPLARPL